MRTCHTCLNKVEDGEWCQTCIDAFEERRAPETMTPEEKAEELKVVWGGPMEIPFAMVHQRIEELLGRPVWTHEMGLNWEGLVEEARTGQHPTFQDVIDLFPPDKKVIVVDPTDEDAAKQVAEALGEDVAAVSDVERMLKRE